MTEQATSFEYEGHTVTLQEDFRFSISGPLEVNVCGSASEAKEQIDQAVRVREAQEWRSLSIPMLDERGNPVTITVVHGGITSVFDATMGSDAPPMREALANARLIAAAPEMAKTRITIDLSDWELGSWPEEVEEAMEVRVEPTGPNEFALRLLNGGAYAAIAAKIAVEAVDTFINGDGTYAEVAPEGVRILSESFRTTNADGNVVEWGGVMIPWMKRTDAHGETINAVSGTHSLSELVEFFKNECEFRGVDPVALLQSDNPNALEPE